MTAAQQPVTTEARSDELVMVDSVDAVFHLTSNWHRAKIAMLEHMKEIPDGSEVTIEGEPPLVLTGEALRGFKLGLSLAISEMDTLPFVAEEVPPAPVPLNG